MYNLELIQLSPTYPRAKRPRYNYNIIPSIQSQVPFLEIKNPIPPMRENFITHDYNTKHAKSSKEKNQINYNNHIIYEEQINEELDQSFGVGFDIENFYDDHDDENENRNNKSYIGSNEHFQACLSNRIYPPDWTKVNSTCGDVWLELFQICRKRNIPNSVLDCILGWVNKYFLLKNEKGKKLPNYSKYFYSNLMNLLPVIQSEPKTLISNKWESEKNKWNFICRKGDIEYCSPIQWINYLVNSNVFENIIISPTDYFHGFPVDQKNFKPMQISETKGFIKRNFIKKEEETLLLISFYYDHHKTGKSSLGGLYMFVENVKSCWRMKDPLIFLIANFPYELKIYDVLKKTKLVEDLKLLENGIRMGTKFVKAKVYSVVGDLPAQLEARGRIMHQGLYSCANCNLQSVSLLRHKLSTKFKAQ
ncbi:hypothetical protein M0813_26577 [Anaeramoeba flamelloides]|uniref:Transposase n=1 Tax=Anaeramoeba flamelloides TaxID=1746091 RepID=A0ABQ8Y0K3_9EUKA|nr:hypothetical protein M0813_26577 [Anaeramoeba flamelloides]